ncbi:alpha-D-ribose 1-methylphosphonate 5-triphosphate diphosphatase [[Mycobacterium] burgundiense]|uniref:Alpha-D-ribose 1-methylphosphonate 5-triphosphate diphosphatase n=1 Tax=[Mycobacterium] burgundiense TaxID=3064286 RepID=A0ABM9LPU8_9MYCO|nr:alpha-D-ribose 1-methylphosphonate 5-triphosphate diphosphatase [Mycolicibacterium sp. MU0053]CAJ1502617.1 alpha-D-ribose 1-methylphosphonate 5-triphosphate diphosphatase [Mycolicibacterium sp. MU0053]
MGVTVLDGLTVVPGGGRPVIPDATVTLDEVGRVLEIAANSAPTRAVLLPAAVDLHLDNLVQRRQPRATVTLDHEAVLPVLDAECAAAGIATVCIAVRCEHSPRKGIEITDAPRLAAAIERLGPELACDWRVHARVELTDERSVETLAAVLAATSRVALISVIETSAERSRFGSLEATRAFYAEDWGISEAEVEAMFTVDPARLAGVGARRAEVAALARAHGIVLASHDDRTPEHVQEAFDHGARVAEFPLTMDAARHARRLGMHVVLGAPNAVRGRSTSTGNVLASEAAEAGCCDVLCSDYLPSALQAAPYALVRDTSLSLSAAVDLISTNPAAVLGLPDPSIAVGKPLTGSLRRIQAGPNGDPTAAVQVGMALWRDGQLVFGRVSEAFRLSTTTV